MSFLDYFRCCCCKVKAIDAPPDQYSPAQVRTVRPTMVSYDFDRASGFKRAFDALPENKEKTLPSRDSGLAK